MKSLKNLNFEKIQNVGIRVDFNVPINKNFRITDKTRLDRSKETIDFIKNKQCNIFLISHFGRPKENFDEKYSFSKLIDQFEDILELKLNFISYDSFLDSGLNEIDVDKPTISLLENIRFFEGEIKNDLNFSKSITDKLDLYVNEAFSASHRFHSSVNQMAKNILSAPGFNFEREILAIDNIKKSSKKKLAIIGGSKVSTKIKTLLSLTSSCSDIFIGGAMANNFFKYNSINVSNSLIEEGSESMIEMIYNSAKSSKCKIHLPSDVILDSNENYSVYNFQKDFEEAYNSIIHRNKNIIVCGGTGLYIESLLLDYNLTNSPPPDVDLRNKLKEKSINELIEYFEKINNKNINNPKLDTKNRVIRNCCQFIK